MAFERITASARSPVTIQPRAGVKDGEILMLILVIAVDALPTALRPPDEHDDAECRTDDPGKGLHDAPFRVLHSRYPTGMGSNRCCVHLCNEAAADGR